MRQFNALLLYDSVLSQEVVKEMAGIGGVVVHRVVAVLLDAGSNHILLVGSTVSRCPLFECHHIDKLRFGQIEFIADTE